VIVTLRAMPRMRSAVVGGIEKGLRDSGVPIVGRAYHSARFSRTTFSSRMNRSSISV
jgi:hypothetical protein